MVHYFFAFHKNNYVEKTFPFFTHMLSNLQKGLVYNREMTNYS